MYINLQGFAGEEAVGSEWWVGLPGEVQTGVAGWITAAADRHGLTATWDGSARGVGPLLRAFDRAGEDGGGFVVGPEVLCPPTAPGAVTQTVDFPARCPNGTGGVGGEAIRELSTDELLRQLEEAKRRERMLATPSLPKGSVTLPGTSPGIPIYHSDALQDDALFVPKTGESTGPLAPKPWYRKTWPWLLIGGAVVATGTVVVVGTRRSR